MNTRIQTLSMLLALCLTIPPAALSATPESASEPAETGVKELMVWRGSDGEVVRWRPHHLLRRAFLGLSSVHLTSDLTSHFGVPEESAVMVSQVVDDGPAGLAGVRVGDILTRISDRRVATTSDLISVLAANETGEEVTLEVWRGGSRLELVATPTMNEAPAFDVSPVVHRFVQRIGAHPAESVEDFLELDVERLDRAMIGLRERLRSCDFETSFERMEEERRSMEERIEELESQLSGLESELRHLAGDDS